MRRSTERLPSIPNRTPFPAQRSLRSMPDVAGAADVDAESTKAELYDVKGGRRGPEGV